MSEPILSLADLSQIYSEDFFVEEREYFVAHGIGRIRHATLVLMDRSTASISLLKVLRKSLSPNIHPMHGKGDEIIQMSTLFQAGFQRNLALTP